MFRTATGTPNSESRGLGPGLLETSCIVFPTCVLRGGQAGTASISASDLLGCVEVKVLYEHSCYRRFGLVGC